MNSIPWNRTSKNDNDVEALMLTQDKNLRYIAVITSKIMIASLGNFPQYSEKNVKVVTGKIQMSHKKILVVSLGIFSFVPTSKPLLFELFSDATSVCQCYMNMWNAIKFDYSDG